VFNWYHDDSGTNVDTIDGALMTLLYLSSSTDGTSAPNPNRIFTSILLTGLSIAIALTISAIQLLTLIYNVRSPVPQTGFWIFLGWINDHYDLLGGLICGVFLLMFLGILVSSYRRRATVPAE
jgi:nickel/cobalt transporter (NiCoT) family protein